ncbi:MAG: pyridoxamine 5'-phosphate oxidase family protein [Prolixibacteraceae bacterium]|nr:pyridoxamine 5'-phosphate oxidase family protein [Prolixibacteraceae bacterium]
MRRRDREVVDKNEIIGILEKADACRIAFSADDIPYIVCMNYGFEWKGDFPVLYFHCAHEGKKIEMLKRNNYVCFQLDAAHELHYIPEKVYCTMYYESIVGMGHLEIVSSEDERRKSLDLLMQRYNGEAPAAYPENSMMCTTILRLVTIELTAKKNLRKT